jgi:hypothetical protein
LFTVRQRVKKRGVGKKREIKNNYQLLVEGAHILIFTYIGSSSSFEDHPQAPQQP